MKTPKTINRLTVKERRSGSDESLKAAKSFHLLRLRYKAVFRRKEIASLSLPVSPYRPPCVFLPPSLCLPSCVFLPPSLCLPAALPMSPSLCLPAALPVFPHRPPSTLSPPPPLYLQLIAWPILSTRSVDAGSHHQHLSPSLSFSNRGLRATATVPTSVHPSLCVVTVSLWQQQQQQWHHRRNTGGCS